MKHLGSQEPLMTTTIPAERIVPGRGIQRVHVIHPETGKVVRLLTHLGTVEQARAAARLAFMHPTAPGYVDTVAIVQGLDDAAKARFAANVTRLYGPHAV